TSWALQPFQYLPPGLTLHPDGVIDGTPTARGQFFVQVKATDLGGHILIRGFSILTYGPGEIPPLNLPIGPNLTGSIGQFTLQLNGTGGTPPYHYSLTPGAPEVPGMRVQDGQPLPTFFSTTVTGGFIGVLTAPGTYNTSIRVTDSVGHSFDRAISLTVSPLALLSSSSPPQA